MIVHRNGEDFFRLFLSDDVFIQEILDLLGFQKVDIRSRSLFHFFVFQFLLQNVRAAWTSFLIENGKIGDLEKIYVKQAKEAADEVKSERNVETATEIYDCMNDYILDGMPCDRVNEITYSGEDAVQWIRRICVHKDIWEKEDVDVNIFYRLRSMWIKEFVHELNSNFRYIEFDDKEFCISKNK